jgi:glucose/arabinose dehydrogenase
VAALAVGAALLAPAAGCSGEATIDDAVVLVAGAGSPFVALTVTPDGGLVYGELQTGVVWRLDAPGRASGGTDGYDREPEVVARLEVATEGQRGVLGLAFVDDRLFASWVRPGDLRLVVGELGGSGEPRLVWEGPVTAETANGGTVVAPADGTLVIGIGDLRDPERVADPAAPNGKLLVLDPDGPPEQLPKVRSGGWNNPFALTLDSDRQGIWVADNHPLDTPERLALDVGAPEVAILPRGTAPAAVATDGRRVWVCGNKSGALLAYERGGRKLAELGPTCRTGLALLPDGRLVWANDAGLELSADRVSGGG